eukprot:SAG22_NODE_11407_length_486_cov_1.245478_1_plen_59_part_10
MPVDAGGLRPGRTVSEDSDDAMPDVDFEGLELIDVRLEIKVGKLTAYLEANSDRTFLPG